MPLRLFHCSAFPEDPNNPGATPNAGALRCSPVYIYAYLNNQPRAQGKMFASYQCLQTGGWLAAFLIGPSARYPIGIPSVSHMISNLTILAILVAASHQRMDSFTRQINISFFDRLETTPLVVISILPAATFTNTRRQLSNRGPGDIYQPIRYKWTLEAL
jgi:hypothetical protein